jgi:integrase
VSKLRTVTLASRWSGPHNFVFTTRTGSGHDHRNVGGRVLSRAVERAGLGAVVRSGEVVLPAPTMHALRHSRASAHIAAN